jgi:hypothetical protein
MITEIVSFDGNTFLPDYEIGFTTGSEPRLPSATVQTLERIGAWPVIVALQRKPQRLALLIRIVGDDRHALRSQLFRWFDPEDETPKTLVGLNHDGIAMSVQALCEDLRVYGDQQHDTCFVTTLAVGGDVRWRAVTATDETWNITASGQTLTIDNSGEDEAYPILEITPTGAKTSGYDYKRYVLVTYRGSNAGPNYPNRLGPLDTAAIIAAGHMQADGDDLRVFVDGLEVPRHLVDINDANTYIWFTTDWLAAQTADLETAIGGVGVIDSIVVDDASGFPMSGAVRIDNEVFTYAARDVVNHQLTGITREAWDTAAGAHGAGSTVYWMQHEILMVYGDATATAPAASPQTEPVFELDLSDNDNWVFEIFGETAYPNRPGTWERMGNVTLAGYYGLYSAAQRNLASPYTVAGIWFSAASSAVRGWSLYNPCGIVNADWADGQKRVSSQTWMFRAAIRYWVRQGQYWATQVTIAEPAGVGAWENWAEAAGANWDPADQILLVSWAYPSGSVGGFYSDVEVGTVEVTLNNAETPVTAIGNEIANYTQAATITNETTDEALTVTFEMEVNETLEVDTDELTVVYQADGSNQFQAVSLDSARRHWLRLLPGFNTLRFDDVGLATASVVITFHRRYY